MTSKLPLQRCGVVVRAFVFTMAVTAIILSWSIVAHQTTKAESVKTTYTSSQSVILHRPQPEKAYQVDTGYFFSCAATTNRSVYCAGSNGLGELGDGTATNSSTPVQFVLPNSKYAKEVTTDYYHSCALSTDQTVYCSGANNYGQLGDDSYTNRSTPVQFQLPAGKRAAVVSSDDYYHVCVLTTDQLVYCAGRGDNGQLGNGLLSNQATPVEFQLPAGKKAAQVRTDETYTCVRTIDFLIFCSGNNTYGQLGDGSYTNRSTPVQFQLPAGKLAAQVSDNFSRTCGLTTDQEVYCAGSNPSGQLGDGTNVGKSTPVKFQLPAGKGASKISTHNYYTNCVVTSDQELYCAGNNNYGQLGVGNTFDQYTPILFQLPAGKEAVQIASSNFQVCATTADQITYCAGNNNYGQLSDGTTTNRSTPVQFQLPAGQASSRVITSNDFICIISRDQILYCSGRNAYGQLGDGTTTDRTTAVKFILPQ